MKWPSYEEWADSIETVDTIEQPNFTRDTYILPNGSRVSHDAVMPRHMFAKSYSRAALFQLQLPLNTELPDAGEIIEGYGEPGMGFPHWMENELCEDPLKTAYEYEHQRYERPETHRPRT
jgi:hypothetical protein